MWVHSGNGQQKSEEEAELGREKGLKWIFGRKGCLQTGGGGKRRLG